MATAIVTWAAQSFVSGALNKAGGMAFNRLMESLGLAPEDPSKDIKEILRQLTAISAQWQGLALGIQQINQGIKELAKQLDISTLEIEQMMQKTNLGSALSNIRTHAGASAAKARAAHTKPRGKAPMVRVTSLAEILDRELNGDKVTGEMLERFFDSVLDTWDILKSVTEINLGMLGENPDDGILGISTRLSIARMGRGDWDPSLLAHYEMLEGRFLDLLAVQMQGVFLVVAAKSQGAASGKIPREAARYLWDEYVPRLLHPQLDRFLWCAEKLVLSQGAWRSPWPIPESTTITDVHGRVRPIGGLGAPPDLGRILLRSELVVRRLKESFRDMRNYKPRYPDRRPLDTLTDLVRTQGYYAHLLCRETEINDGDKGPELKPWPDSASRGAALPATGALIPHWDPAQKGRPGLKEPEQSSLRVVRYFWPQIEFPGTEMEKIFTDAMPTAKPYGRDDLAGIGLDWPGMGSVSHSLNLRNLCIVPEAGPWMERGLRINRDNSDGHIDWRWGRIYSQRPLMSPRFPEDVEFRPEFALRGWRVGRGGGTIDEVMGAPLFHYDGKKPRQLTLHLWMVIVNGRSSSDGRAAIGHMNGHVVAKLWSPAGETELYDSAKVSNFSLWDWKGDWKNPRTSKTDEARLNIVVNVGQTGKPEDYFLNFYLDISHDGSATGESRIGVTIKDCTVSWMPPPPSPTPKAASKAGQKVKVRSKKAAAVAKG